MSFLVDWYAEYGTLIAAFTLVALLVLSSLIGFAPNKWRWGLMVPIVMFAALNAFDFYVARVDQKSTEQKVSAALSGLESRLEAATNKMQELSSSLEKAGAQLTGIDTQSRSIQADLGEARAALNEIPKLTSDLGVAITTLQGRIDRASQDTSKGLNQLTKETARQRSILKCQDEERVRSNSLYGSAFNFGTTPCAK